jgi:hypothetical protein
LARKKEGKEQGSAHHQHPNERPRAASLTRLHTRATAPTRSPGPLCGTLGGGGPARSHSLAPTHTRQINKYIDTRPATSRNDRLSPTFSSLILRTSPTIITRSPRTGSSGKSHPNTLRKLGTQNSRSLLSASKQFTRSLCQIDDKPPTAGPCFAIRQRAELTLPFLSNISLALASSLPKGH